MRLFLILSYYFSLVWAIKRKSLGFGPINPNAVFHSTPTLSYFSSFITDPFDLAHHFIQSLNPTSSYHIRKDSYTDPLTGVSHIYVRQLINGLEVVDGDININIKDSTVLSYGNSVCLFFLSSHCLNNLSIQFYNGPIPTPLSNDHITSFQDIHKHSCDLLTPDSPDHLFNSNCHFLHLPSHLSSNDLSDFRPALLKFIIAATPHHHLAAHILDNFQSHMDRITVTPLSHLVPSVGSIQYSIDNVPDTVSPVLANMAYIQVPNQSGDDTELHLVWKVQYSSFSLIIIIFSSPFQFEVEMIDNWYETAVSASPPHNIISVVDWASDAPLPDSKSYASYNVFKWGVNDPTVGNRSFEKESFDAIASPAGWHALPYSLDPTFQDKDVSSLPFWRNTTSTWGNNVFAQENWKGQGSYIQNLRPDAGHLKVFDYSYDPQVTEKTEALEEAQKYIDAAVVQLFYTTNLVHDLYYRYGFHELSGNFQQYNFDKGGEESDAIIANAQDGSGYNNANFMTPPDGRNGRMRMYLWNTAVPFRDGDLEAGIVIHELSHGLSTRMTGGPANSGCLGWGEAGGMGEGWGDFLATTVRSNETYADYPMGAWAANLEGGIRHHIYSRVRFFFFPSI